MNLNSSYANFVNSYTTYLSNLIKSGQLNGNYSLYFKTEKFEELRNLIFIRAERTNYFQVSGHDMWKVDTNDDFFYFRSSAGIILLSQTDRLLRLPYTEFERIALFVPPAAEFVYGFRSFKQLADILKLKTKNNQDIEVNWN